MKKKRIRISPTRIILLIFIVMTNSFAWFIYATKVDSNVTVHVRGWNVVFEAGQNQISDIVNLNVGNIYPGMQNYNYSITAYNRSEVSATLSYQILEANILGTNYISIEGRAARGEAAVASDLSSSALEYKLSHDYPFTISAAITSSTIQSTNGHENYSFSVVWPYESGNDALDTQWGIAADTFKRNNPNASSITLKIKVIITQNAV